jgi:hypothetical protein
VYLGCVEAQVLAHECFKLPATVTRACRRPDAAPRRLKQRASGFKQALDPPPAERLDVLIADAQTNERKTLQAGDEFAVDLPRLAKELLDAPCRADRSRVLAHILVDVPGEQRLQWPERKPSRGDTAAAVGAQQPAIQRRQGASAILQAGLAARW